MEQNLETRRKRIRFRSWHRGTKEMDLLMGTFADRHLAELDGDQLDRFEALLDLPEPVVYNWIVGRDAPDADHDHDVMAQLRSLKLKLQSD